MCVLNQKEQGGDNISWKEYIWMNSITNHTITTKKL